MSTNNKNISHSLIAGFALVLALMAFISLTGLHYLHRHNQSMEYIVKVHNEKTRLLHYMQDAMRDMLIITDDFARDEAWQRHNQAGTRFLKAREKLSRIDITPEEEKAFQKMRQTVTAGGHAQKNLVNAILNGQPSKTLLATFNEAVYTQQLAFDQLLYREATWPG